MDCQAQLPHVLVKTDGEEVDSVKKSERSPSSSIFFRKLSLLFEITQLFTIKNIIF